MDQDTLVNERKESGQKLIEALKSVGFDVRVAFWAKPTDEGKWFLYLALPLASEKGPKAAYRQVYHVMRQLPELWIEPLEVKVLPPNDSLVEAALEVTSPKIPVSPYAIRNPRPYPGMTRFAGPTLGGVSIDEAYIYASLQTAPTA